jgi:acetyl-CoA carboxylase, biotin carboxylase subunit
MFKKILIANRGEIAVRVIRACRDLGIQTVAVYSDVDRGSLHVRYADEAYCVGSAPATESYLKDDVILAVAKKAKVDAIHPGYGFLSENAAFVRAAEKAGIAFIGPAAESMEAMGGKVPARKIAMAAKVPVVPGQKDVLKDVAEAKKVAQEVGYPIMLKAVMGGGGKGMRLIRNESEVESAFQMASSEALQSFKDASLYIEKYIESPHHIEVQIMADQHGNVAVIGERECSVQRRHQKVIEEAPSPYVSPETRQKMYEAAARLVKHAKYYNAGTLEFLVDKDQNFYFLEMNTRLQVEHPVTELVTGLDLVHLQIAVAAGEKISLPEMPPPARGAGIECRIYAEDPDSGFLPSPGKILDLRQPEGPGVRVDSAAFAGGEISIYYDPMVAKLLTWGPNREVALARMQRALGEYHLSGIKTNIGFLQEVVDHPVFKKGHYNTHFIADHFGDREAPDHSDLEEVAIVAAGIAQILKKKRRKISFGGSTGDEKSPTSLWKAIGRNQVLRNS